MIATEKSDIENLRRGGKILAGVLHEVAKLTVPGATTAELDIVAERMIRERGAVPAFLGYKPSGASYAFPAALCVSVNDEVVHGIPSEVRVLRSGDMATIDLGLSYNGLFVDAALTVLVGECDKGAQNLLLGTTEALKASIVAVRPGAHFGDIGAAVEAVAKKYKLSVVEELGGHALGKTPHEKPFISNVGKKGQGAKIVLGMVLALEPILTEGESIIVLDDDQWTYRTRDGSRAAHVEHTILVTETGAEILTVR